jgi:mRNA-degrading endonuclease toxin of MazEF toxin-antitoxin module
MFSYAYTDLATGHRTQKLRPCLVYQSNAFISVTKSVMVIPFSSRVSLVMPPTDILIMPDEYNKFSKTSALKIAAMRTVSKDALTEKCGCLSKKDMETVDKACMAFLGFPK